MRTLLAISVFWAAAVPFLLCTLVSAGERPKKIVAVEGITEYQLENGLRLLLYPDSSRPKVTVNMTVLVGSRHEVRRDRHGPSAGAPALQRHANTPQHSQGASGSWRPVQRQHLDGPDELFETVPASDENLEFFIRMEADRLVNSYVKKEDLDSEMTVARNEFERERIHRRAC